MIKMYNLNYQLKRYEKTLATDKFFRQFNDFDTVQGYCKNCPRYNTNYSCSPVDINPAEYITSFDKISITVTQLRYYKNDYTKDYSKQEVEKILENTFYKERSLINQKVLAREQDYKKAVSLTGPCHECSVKCRVEYEKCIHPDKMRYSFASLGINSTSVLKKVFNIQLIPIRSNLPKYLNHISPLLYCED